MKLNSNIGTGLKSNVQEKSLGFGIGDPAKIIEILRKRLYSNPIQTLVQEYVSNARDACRESGMQEKIVVTIPTETNKVFKVRDYGVGISPDRIANVFVNYGSSTKDSDNKQTGGFGIGAKSAWAYTDNFTVISYYNGVVRHYSAHVAKTNNGSLDLISESETSEANGTEIQIAVAQKDLKAFESAVYRCTFFWDNKPTLRGIPPSNIPLWYKQSKPVYSANNIQFFKQSDLGPLYATIGIVLSIDGIPYPLNHNFDDATQALEANREFVCVISVNTGEVEVSASRESVADSEHTQEKIKELIATVNKTFEQNALAELKKAKNLAEFLKIHGTIHEVTPIVKTVAFREYAVTNGYLEKDVNGLFGINNSVFVLEHTKKDKSKLRLNQKDQTWGDLHEYSYLYLDKDLGKVTIYEKVRTYLQGLPSDAKRQAVLFTSADPESNEFKKLASELNAVVITSIEVEKKVVQKRPDGQITATVFANPSHYGRSGRSHDGVTIDLNTNQNTYVYVEKPEIQELTETKRRFQAFATMLREQFELTFCFLAKGVIKKIEGNSQFIPYTEFYNHALKLLPFKTKIKIENELISEQITNILSDIGSLLETKSFIESLSKVKDHTLVEALTKLRFAPSESHHYYSHSSDKNHWIKVKDLFKDANPELAQTASRYNGYAEYVSKYPLLSQVGRIGDDSVTDDLILYLNAKYEASNGKK